MKRSIALFGVNSNLRHFHHILRIATRFFTRQRPQKWADSLVQKMPIEQKPRSAVYGGGIQQPRARAQKGHRKTHYRRAHWWIDLYARWAGKASQSEQSLSKH